MHDITPRAAGRAPPQVRHLGRLPRHPRPDLRRLRPGRLRHGRSDSSCATPSEIGEVTPAVAGALGSYALIGVLVGALLAGSVGDVLGRRKVMLAAYAWFSIGMGVTALMTTTTMFGLLRFVTGLGVGALVATTGALVAEFAPPGKKNLAQRDHLLGRAAGQPAGRAAGHPAARRDRLARHVLIGALPAGDAAAAGLPQDAGVAGLAGRPAAGSTRPGRSPSGPACRSPSAAPRRRGAAAPAAASGPGSPGCSAASTCSPRSLLGLMSATGLLLVYSLNTWLPELMLPRRASTQGLAGLPAGAQRRRGARRAGRAPGSPTGSGPKPVVAGVAS